MPLVTGDAGAGTHRSHMGSGGVTIDTFQPIDPNGAVGGGRARSARRSRDGGPVAERFLAVGLRLQRADPARVPVAVDSVRARIAGDFPFFAYGEALGLVARSGGRDVGRVMAIANWHARDRAGRPVGYLGFWECEDDDAAAHALLDAAIGWLSAPPRNLAAVIGPIDYSTWHSYRFSVPEEPRHPTFWLEPVTADHSPGQWMRYGFKPSYRYLSTRTTRLDLIGGHDAIDAARDDGYSFRTFDMSDPERELFRVYEMSVAGFADMRLFTPIGWREFRSIYAGMHRIIVPELAIFAVAPDGSDVGIAFNIPNFIDAARRMGGSASTIAKLRFLHGRGSPPDLLLKSMTVLPEHQHGRIGEALMQLSYVEGIRHGFTGFYHALMYAGNLSVLNLVSTSGAEQVRRYALLRFDTGAVPADRA